LLYPILHIRNRLRTFSPVPSIFSVAVFYTNALYTPHTGWHLRSAPCQRRTGETRGKKSVTCARGPPTYPPTHKCSFKMALIADLVVGTLYYQFLSSSLFSQKFCLPTSYQADPKRREKGTLIILPSQRHGSLPYPTLPVTL
jgi:hypothetical protein